MDPNLDALANERKLTPFSSWEKGRPAGFYDLPMTEKAATFYRENGFLVVDRALSPSEVEELRNETAAICLGKLGELEGVTPIAGETADEAMERYLCIHFPHKISKPMEATLAHPVFIDVLTRIIGQNVKCMQSMLFIKSSGKPGQAWHQDEIYIPTRDRSLTGGWIALDDATVENGCLWVIPGSQSRNVLYFQEWHGDPRFDCALEAQGFPYTDADAVPVEVKAGSIVFFNGYLLHRSLPNRAPSGYRRALVNHYMSAESLLPWIWKSEGTREPVSQLDVRDIVMIAGEDPYAWRGVDSIHQPHVRPSGKGGCGSNEYNKRKG